MLSFSRRIALQNKSFAKLAVKGFSTQAIPNEAKCPVHSSEPKKPVPKPKQSITSQSDEAYQKAIPYDKIPGPKPLPLIGIAHMFLPGGKYHNKQLLELHRMLKDEFGDVVKFPGFFGKNDNIFAFNPNDMEVVFRTEGPWPYRRGLEVFQQFRQKERPELFEGVGGLLQDQGELWQDTRTKVNPVMLQPKTVKSYVSSVENIVDDFIERIKSIRDKKSEVPANFSNEMNKWALESIAFIALEQRLNLLGEIDKDSDGQRLIQSVHDFFELSFQLEVLPSLWKVYPTASYKKMMKTLHTMTNIITKFIDKSIAEFEQRTTTKTEESVLEKLLKIDRRVAIIMALDMLMAGVDTTSMASLTLMYQLAKNPEKQAILREEIRQKLPNKDSKLTVQAMSNMPYLRACMKEAARLHPVAIGTARRTHQNIVVSGYQIPKGVDVILSQMILANDENYYRRSSEFLPERFLKSETDSSLKTQNPFAYLPFGFGPRMCIGKRFAELEIELLAIKLVRNFDIQWHHPEMKYVSKLLNMPSGDLKFRLVDIKE